MPSLKTNKIVTVIMGQNCEKFIGMCLESVKDSDAIVYCDGGSDDRTMEIASRFSAKYDMGVVRIIQNEYDQGDLGMNGK